MEQLQQIQDTVIKIIADKLKKNPELIALEATLIDLGADSLDIVEIIMSLEETFSIHIDDQEAEKLHTIQDVVKYIYQLKIEG